MQSILLERGTLDMGGGLWLSALGSRVSGCWPMSKRMRGFLAGKDLDTGHSRIIILGKIKVLKSRVYHVDGLL